MKTPSVAPETAAAPSAVILQFSAGQGPEECERAVRLAVNVLLDEAEAAGVEPHLGTIVAGVRTEGWKSATVVLEGPGAPALAKTWTGTLKWVCTSPGRRGPPRKNWFVGVTAFSPVAGQSLKASDVAFETLKSSGAGGQHVNRTESAVRATHVPSGLVVRVQTQRSQHANKRLALLLLEEKIAAAGAQAHDEAGAEQRLAHHRVERGQAVRTFRGQDFIPV